jgi:hypothetical protein
MNHDTSSLASPDSAEGLRTRRVGDASQSEEGEPLLSIVARDTLGFFSRHEAMAEANDTEAFGSELFVLGEEVVPDFGGERGSLGGLNLGVGKISQGRIQNTLSLDGLW